MNCLLTAVPYDLLHLALVFAQRFADTGYEGRLFSLFSAFFVGFLVSFDHLGLGHCILLFGIRHPGPPYFVSL